MFKPITTLEDLKSIDDLQAVAGYRAAKKGYVLSGHETRSFIHGWRNGLADSGVVEKDESQVKLTREFLKLQGKPKS